MIDIKIDAKQAIKDLKQLRQKAIPYAIRNALNRSAFHAREEWQNEIRGSFTLRNHFTERSFRVERATGTNARQMVAILGSVAPYMGDQEEGATIRGKGAHKPIPGPVAAGQGPGGHRTRMVRAGNRLSALHARKGVGKTRLQRNAVAVAMAKRAGEKSVLLERGVGGGKAIFKLMGARKKAVTRLLWDFSRRSVKVTPEPTLQRTLKRVTPRVEQFHVEAVVEQLRRHKILGY